MRNCVWFVFVMMNDFSLAVIVECTNKEHRERVVLVNHYETQWFVFLSADFFESICESIHTKSCPDGLVCSAQNGSGGFIIFITLPLRKLFQERGS